MTFANQYFKRHSYSLPIIQEPPSWLLSFIVVIPVYKEENLLACLEALLAANKISEHIEILLVFNYSEADSIENKTINASYFQACEEWSHMHSIIDKKFIPIIVPDMPKKHAGVGLARKLGMDLALQRFAQLDNRNGVILSLDADTLVETNYFESVKESFNSDPTAGVTILQFAHPLEGSEYESIVYDSICQYELHLRYYKNILDFIKYPHSNYTIGSCFGVKAQVYAKHGGMNKQKGGEDFYFLNKLMPHESFLEIKDTCVHPSSRPSYRVPFGTGPVIRKMTENKEKCYFTYNPEAFFEIERMLHLIPSWYLQAPDLSPEIGLGDILIEFLKQNQLDNRLKEIRSNTSSEKAFVKRFLLWFDGFKVVKFLNYSHKEHYQRITVTAASQILLPRLGISLRGSETPKKLLELFRERDKSGVK